MTDSKEAAPASIRSLVLETIALTLAFVAACAVYWASVRLDLTTELKGLLWAIGAVGAYATTRRLCGSIFTRWFALARDVLTKGQAISGTALLGFPGIAFQVSLITFGIGIATWIGAGESTKTAIAPVMLFGGIAFLALVLIETISLGISAWIWRGYPRVEK